MDTDSVVIVELSESVAESMLALGQLKGVEFHPANAEGRRWLAYVETPLGERRGCAVVGKLVMCVLDSQRRSLGIVEPDGTQWLLGSTGELVAADFAGDVRTWKEWEAKQKIDNGEPFVFESVVSSTLRRSVAIRIDPDGHDTPPDEEVAEACLADYLELQTDTLSDLDEDSDGQIDFDGKSYTYSINVEYPEDTGLEWNAPVEIGS